FCFLGLPRLGPIVYYLVAVCLLVTLCFSGYFSARFRSSNWLVELTNQELLIKFRSYLNYRFSDDDPTVISIPLSEIRSARPVREKLRVPDNEGGTSTRTERWIELELTTGSREIAEALALEMTRPAPQTRFWIIKTSTRYQHYPVQMTNPGFLRVEWAVTPGPSTFLNVLRPLVSVLPEVVVSNDFANLKQLPVDEQERRLRDLDARGDTVSAIYIARQLRNCGLADAKTFIESLRREPLTPAGK